MSDDDAVWVDQVEDLSASRAVAVPANPGIAEPL
jgi:hypothetical protein